MTTLDRIGLQNAEFDAMTKLSEAWAGLRQTAVVDDDYPEMRHRYEGAVGRFLAATAANRSSGGTANRSSGGTVNRSSGGTVKAALEWATSERDAAREMFEAANVRIEDLEGRLALADAAFMMAIGRFPLDRTNVSQRLINDACSAVREITGEDYEVRTLRAHAYRATWLAKRPEIPTPTPSSAVFTNTPAYGGADAIVMTWRNDAR